MSGQKGKNVVSEQVRLQELEIEKLKLQIELLRLQQEGLNQSSSSRVEAKKEVPKKERKPTPRMIFFEEEKEKLSLQLKEEGFSLPFDSKKKIINTQWKLTRGKDADPQRAAEFFPFLERFSLFLKNNQMEKNKTTFKKFVDDWFRCLDEVCPSEYKIFFHQQQELMRERGEEMEHGKMLGHIRRLWAQERKEKGLKEEEEGDE